MKSRYNRLFVASALGLALMSAATCPTAWGAEIGGAQAPASTAGASQTITGTQVWRASASPRLVHGVVTVAEGASLTIEAGADVQFDADLSAGIHVLGKLNVAGTPERLVTLHAAASDKDARWRGIWTDTKTASVTISSARLSGAVTGVEDRGGSVRLSSTEISGSIRAALAGGKAASLTVEDAKLSNNTFGIDAFDGATVSATGTAFLNNRTAISVSRTGVYLSSNEFSGNRQGILTDDAGLVKGSSNRLAVEGKATAVEIAALVTRPSVATVSGSINADITWTTSQSPILVSSNLHVATGATLTIQPGVVVRFAAGGDSGLTVDGRLVAVGTEAKPIYFTSSLDKGSGFSIAPSGFETGTASAGDWSGIHLNGSAGKSTLQHVTVRYSRNGIVADGASVVDSSNNSFRDDITGISVSGASASVNSSSDSFVNNVAGVQVSAGNASINSAAFAYGSIAISGSAGASASVASSTVSAVATPVAKQAGFELAMNAGALKPLAISSASFGQSAAPAAVRIGTDVPVTNIPLPSFSTVPGSLPSANWTVPQNRLAPNVFATGSNLFGTTRSNELNIGISNAQAPLAGNGLGIYQGYQYASAGNTINYPVADLFIPSAWQLATTAPVASYIWATGNNGDYSVVGFRNYSTGTGVFSVWNDTTGAFVDLPSVAVNYGAWNTLSIAYSGTNAVYYINGVQVSTTPLYLTSNSINAVFMNAVNFFSPDYTGAGLATRANYSALWSDTLAPVISPTSFPTQLSGTALSKTLTATEGAGPYAWAFGVGGSPSGSGLALDPVTGVLSTTGAAASSYSIPVKVTDANNQVTNQSISWLVANPLTIVPASPPAATAGVAYAGFTFASLGGASIPTWSLQAGSTLPPGLSLSIFGALTGTVTAGTAPGPYSFVVVANDGFTTPSPTAAVTVTVYAPLAITTASLPAGVRNQAYPSTTVLVSGGSGSYIVTGSGFPTGLSISSSGVITGTPTSGTSTATILVTDNITKLTTTTTFNIVVTVPPLTLSVPSLVPLVAVNGAVSGTFSASGGTSPYHFVGTTLPPGVSLSDAGVLSGAPNQPGSFTYSVQVNDSASASASTSITLLSLGFSPGFSLPAGTVNVQYSAQFSAPGVTGVTFTSSSSLDGLTLAPSGLLSGKPAAAGSFPLSVTVTSGTVSVTGSYSLSISAAPVPLTLTGATLPNAQVKAAYSATIAASGGTAPYTYTLTGGTLDPGLSFASGTGLIFGSPSAAGASVFTVQAKDSVGATASGSFTITILPAALIVPTTTFPNGVVGVTYPAQVLGASGGTPPFHFTVSSGTLPTGLSLTDGGSLSGLPSASGTFPFGITITDSGVPTVSVNTAGSITISSNASANLILSQSSLSFTVNSGTTVATLPASASVDVTSSVALQLLNYTVSSSVTWLTVTPGNGTIVSTPGNAVSVGLNAATLTLPVGASTATIVVTCVAPSPCAGASQNIGVTVTIAAPPASLAVTSQLLSFSATGTATPPSQTVGLQNKGGGTITGITTAQADTWYTVSGVPTTPLAPGTPVPVTVSINPNNGLSVGYHSSSVTFSSSAGTATVQIGLQISANLLSLSQSGQSYSATVGDHGINNGSFQVGATVAASWTAVSNQPWLAVGTPSGTSTADTPAGVAYLVNHDALGGAGTYFGTIQIASSSASNSPLSFVVGVTVTDPIVPAIPSPSPAGLVFIANTANTNPASKTVTVGVNSAAAVTFAASSSVSWLSVPSTGTTSSSAPGTSVVSVNTKGLKSGFYNGFVGYQINGVGVSVSVLLVVTKAGVTLDRTPVSVLAGPDLSPRATAGCTATQLYVGQTGLLNNFQQRAGLPVPLSAVVVDDCGNFVSNASVNVTFSDGDSPVQLSASAQTSASGTYSGTWTPTAASSQVAVIATASAPGLPSATAQVNGQVTPSSLPILTKGSTTNVYSAVIGAGIAPGSIIMMFGSNLAPSATSATTLPLPTTLGGASVTIGGVPAPLYYAGPTQVNAQMPSGLLAGNQYQIVVSVNGAVTSADVVQVVPVSPGVAETPSGVAIAQHAGNFATVTEANPAKPGEFVILYLSGLGATTVPVAAGAASPSNPLARAVIQPTVTMNGTPVPISFAGLTPTLAGLFQINLQVPANTANGDIQVVVSQSGVAADPVILPVHN